jgi:hypothetical protein
VVQKLWKKGMSLFVCMPKSRKYWSITWRFLWDKVITMTQSPGYSFTFFRSAQAGIAQNHLYWFTDPEKLALPRFKPDILYDRPWKQPLLAKYLYRVKNYSHFDDETYKCTLNTKLHEQLELCRRYNQDKLGKMYIHLYLCIVTCVRFPWLNNVSTATTMG